jgi:dihydroorotate dehydrogenase (NAD+) catalytic subunit
LANPIMTASGTAGHGDELGAYVDLSSLGAVVVKSVSSDPWPGNPAPRLVPLVAAGGMLNSVGLQNLGIDEWLAKELPALTKARAAVVVSIWGFTAAAYRKVAAAIASAVGAGDRFTESIVAVEANISCPNVEDRRSMFAHSVQGVSDAVGAAVSGLSGARPLWAKLSPNVTDLPAMASAALAAGAEGVTLINTVMGMAIDPATGRARLGGGGGGLSGPAIHPVAVRAVFDCRAALPSAPIVGVGGVMSGYDAAELLAAGADAVQVGTATFADPRAPARVLAELAEWCDEQGISTLADLKGRSHVPH